MIQILVDGIVATGENVFRAGMVAATDVVDATLPQSFNTLADSGEDNQIISDDEHPTTSLIVLTR
jgi:hypothetical protein